MRFVLFLVLRWTCTYHLAEEERAGCFTCILYVVWMSMHVSSSGAMDWSVVVAFPGHTHFFFFFTVHQTINFFLSKQEAAFSGKKTSK